MLRRTFGRSVRPFAGNLVVFLAVLLALFGGDAHARRAKAWSSDKYAAIVIDANADRVLFARNADSPRYPASLTKMMTLYMLFTELDSGRMTLSTPMQVSAHAAAQAPSKLGLKPGSTITARTAILALVTKSANDVAAVVAEHIGGTESAFAAKMTAKARAIGMKNTTFRNASGLPNDAQRTTARDMVTLAQSLYHDFPEYFAYFKTRSFAYGGRYYRNHNRLLGTVEGVDGIKTGYTRASGFNLTTSARRGNRHLLAVVMGGPTGRDRDTHMAELLAKFFPHASTKKLPRVARVVLPENPPLPPRRSSAITLAAANAGVPMPPPANVKPHVLPTAEPEPDPQAQAEGDREFETDGEEEEQADLVPGAVQAGADPIAALLSTGTIATRNADEQTTVLTVTPPPPTPVAPDKTVTSLLAERLREPWLIQIGAYNDEAAARERLRAAQGEADILRNYLAYTEPVSKNAETLYRARFSGFDRNGAEAACKALKKAKMGCLAIPE